MRHRVLSTSITPDCRTQIPVRLNSGRAFAEFFHVCAAESFHAAAATEEVVYGVGTKLVIRQNVPSLQQPERGGLTKAFQNLPWCRSSSCTCWCPRPDRARIRIGPRRSGNCRDRSFSFALTSLFLRHECVEELP